jgi:heme A synthase
VIAGVLTRPDRASASCNDLLLVTDDFQTRSGFAFLNTHVAYQNAVRLGQAPVRRAVRAAGAVVLLQLALGITTLLYGVPIALGVLHQLTGLVVLTTVLVAVHASRRRVGK